MNDALHLMYVMVAFGAIFGVAELWHVCGKPPAEWTRKFAHVASGIVVACFHWIFTANWPVIVLGIILGLIMILARKFRMFPWIFGVERRSHGELYYIFAILTLYIISHQHPIFYFISALILTVSDTLAALIGATYHRRSYVVEYHHKSCEGSAAFFLATLLIISISLLLLLDIPLNRSCLIALPIALLLTCLEAICPNGTDNAFIPLSAYILLHQFVHMPSDMIATLFFSEIAILAGCLLISWMFHPFTASGAIALHFFFFGAFVLDDWTWIIPPLLALLFMLFLFTCIYKTAQSKLFKASRVMSMFYITLVPAIIFFLHFLLTNEAYSFDKQSIGNGLYPIYVGAVAGQLIITLWRLMSIYPEEKKFSETDKIVIALLAIAIVIPTGLFVQPQTITRPDIIHSLAVALLTPFFYQFIGQWPQAHQFPWEFRIQMLCTALGSLAVIAFYFLG